MGFSGNKPKAHKRLSDGHVVGHGCHPVHLMQKTSLLAGLLHGLFDGIGQGDFSHSRATNDARSLAG
jgi:hypothetical protein